ncbi:MAG: nitrate reductase associated protein [Deltaproteobacteria bacterium]|nr:nitrate reductase associated protein [Deltaproteobacteria bacterium]
MFNRYQFEADVYKSLDQMPLEVRMKLDETGAKISLKDWLSFSQEERLGLCNLPVEAEEGGGDFVSYLLVLIRKYRGETLELARPPLELPWYNPAEVPDPVLQRSREFAQPISPDEWAQLDVFQRYALIKLSVSKNEPERFRAALEEFREEICHSS